MSSRPNSNQSSGSELFSAFADFAYNAASVTKNITAKGVTMAGGIMTKTADAVGLKDSVEAAESMARKLAAKGKSDANKAVNKARRMASRALDFDDEEDTMTSYDYDLLLSNAGAIEKKIAVYGSHTVNYNLPAGSSLVWKARVKKYDINFLVKEVYDSNESNPITIEPQQKYTPDSLIQGRISADPDRNRTVTLVFDNSHSTLQGKSVVYWVAVGENVSLADDQTTGSRNKEIIAAEEGPPE